MKLLLESGANVHADDDLALGWAAQKGHHEVVKLLLESGANVHAHDDGALRQASRNGHSRVVNLFLKNGATGIRCLTTFCVKRPS